jgi:hypothetical protein
MAAMACAAPRDVVPESRDVTAAPPAAAAGYEYVARRPLGVVGVAESRGLAPEVVKAVADRIANVVDICATNLAREGRLVPAAGRIAAHIDRDGTPVGLSITVTPGPGPTANALLCFVSPFRLVRFPAADVDPADRGLALEATWGPPGMGKPPPAPLP